MKSLKLAKDLSLPLDAVTQTFLVVGKRGSGKSNTAARFVEQLHHAKLPFVVLDPVDTWWGLKADLHGGRGLDVYVFGGRKADLPLNETDGALIAEVLCEHRVSMVLSVKHLSGRARSRFMVAFAQTLFQKWGGGPLHVVLEEAHELAPQMGGRGGNDTDGDAAMLGAFKRLWKLGRASGIGGTAVTQRPASLSKDITTQSEILIAHRTIGPQDVAAIGQWVKYHGEREDILADLPSLPTGEAFIWAPEFPEGKPIGLKRTSVLLRETYDSASTPKVGESRVEPKELAAVDLERLRTKMAATIEKAKADDPKELKRQITELKRELEKASIKAATSTPNAASTLQKAPLSVLTEADRVAVQKFSDKIDALAAEIVKPDDIGRIQAALASVLSERTAVHARTVEQFLKLLDSKRFSTIRAKVAEHPLGAPPIRNRESLQNRPESARPEKNIVVLRGSGPSLDSPPSPAISRNRDNSAAAVGNSGVRRMLIALAQRPQGLSRTQVGIRAGLSPRTGTFATYLGRMRSSGWIDGRGDDLRITDAGRDALGAFDPLPEGADLARYWIHELGGGAGRMLHALVEAYPTPLTREQLGAAANLSDKTGTFATYLGRLRALELATGRGELTASAELFS